MELQLEHPPIKGETAGDVTVVHFTGRKVSLDESSIHGIHDQLLALADERSDSELLLDFGNVEYVSGAALGTLVSLHNKLLAGGRSLTVGNLSLQVNEVLEVTKLNKFLNLRPAVQVAEPAVQNGQSDFPTGILVVDDETAVLRVLAASLRIEGFKVWLASNGHQAIELYRGHLEEIAMVLLDVLMPGIDGPHTLTALQRICSTVRCCYMTGNPGPYSEEALVQSGAIRVFRKPFAFTEIIATLNQLACLSPRRRQDRWIEA
jgi:anti-sigma B factor antagonist